MSEAIITLIMQVKTGEFRGRDNSEVQWEPGGGGASASAGGLGSRRQEAFGSRLLLPGASKCYNLNSAAGFKARRTDHFLRV